MLGECFMKPSRWIEWDMISQTCLKWLMILFSECFTESVYWDQSEETILSSIGWVHEKAKSFVIPNTTRNRQSRITSIRSIISGEKRSLSGLRLVWIFEDYKHHLQQTTERYKQKSHTSHIWPSAVIQPYFMVQPHFKQRQNPPAPATINWRTRNTKNRYTVLKRIYVLYRSHRCSQWVVSSSIIDHWSSKFNGAFTPVVVDVLQLKLLISSRESINVWFSTKLQQLTFHFWRGSISHWRCRTPG